MKKTIDFYDFVKAFEEIGRKENFSQKGLKALFDYIKHYEEDSRVEVEFNVIARCGKFTEYSDFEEFKEEYNDYVEQHNIENLDDLENHTIVIRVDNNGFIIQDF